MCVAFVKCDAHFHFLTVVPSLGVCIQNHPFSELIQSVTFLRVNIINSPLNVKQFLRAQASLRYITQDAYWNNTGDCAYLKDGQCALIGEYCY